MEENEVYGGFDPILTVDQNTNSDAWNCNPGWGNGMSFQSKSEADKCLEKIKSIFNKFEGFKTY